LKISNVVWVQDRLGNAALDLDIDGQQAHIRGSQRSELLARGILEGVSYLRSERSDPSQNAYVRGSYEPPISGADLVGCTDDPEVFMLFNEMCSAIRSGTWVAGRRPTGNLAAGAASDMREKDESLHD
jgi:hypothetical protein